MKKIKKVLLIILSIILVLILTALIIFKILFRTFKKLPYENNAVFEKKEDLIYQFEINENCYDRTNLVYHYIKSNIDDSFKTDVWIYYPDKFHSESFKIYPNSKLQGFLDCICATYDEKKFQFKEIIGLGINKNGNIKINTRGYKENFVRKTVVGDKEIVTKLGIAPCYDINFDLADLNSMLPFLKNIDQNFSFGMTNIKRPHILGPVDILYLGKVDCIFSGQENHNKINCNIFNMKVENFEDLDGKIYVDPITHDLIEINTEHCGNPFFNSLKFKLIDKQRMSPEQWMAFMKKKAKEIL